MIQTAFQHRSGRIIAFGRAVLALFFLIIIWAERAQPAVSAQATYTFLGAYAFAALAYLLLTWDNWWLETRLAAPAHVVDLLVFTSLNFVTQGYTSPFFTFFVFLLLAASIRWGWRETALTAVVIILLYLVEGVTASSWGTEEFEFNRFLIRSSYLLVLSSMIILWFASNQRALRQAALARVDEPGSQELDMRSLLAHAAARLGSQRAVLVWSEREEPWTYVAELDGTRFSQTQHDPGRFDPPIDSEVVSGVFLFDRIRDRGLRRSKRRKLPFRLRAAVHPELARTFRLERGIAIPVEASDTSGALFVLDVPGLCSDDVAVAEEVEGHVSAALDHIELFHATEEAAAMRARLALARDIHDSTMQSLAGFTLRLEGLRKAVSAGRGGIEAEIEDLQRELSREQQDLRRFIAELRAAPSSTPRSDLPAALRTLAGRLASQWGVSCEVESDPPSLEVPAALQRDVEQLVREAIANAVRHGEASAIDTRLEQRNGTVELTIADNGRGFPVRGEFRDEELESRRIGPRSLRERVQALGGSLSLASAESGSRLLISLPIRER